VSEIYVTPFPGPGGKYRISARGGVQPRWRHDGKELFYVAPGGQLIAVPVTFRAGAPDVGKAVTLFDGIDLSVGYRWDVAADGQRFIVARDSRPPDRRPLTLVQNWQSALSARENR
jgi:hypothetical protein